MKLRKLHIEDYKMFKDFDISFVDENDEALPIIVLAGVNGSGKTSLLDSIFNPTFEFKIEVETKEGIQQANNYSASFGMERDGVDYIEADYYYKDIEYYSMRTSVKNIKTLLPKYIENMIFVDGIQPFDSYKKVTDYINEVLKDVDTQIEFDSRDGEGNLFFKNKSGGGKFSIDELSTGEKTLLSKVVFLYLDNTKDKVILIDEPELSLHPSWQNKVLKIYENFATQNECQIIIATHSPHIIGSAKNEYLRILRKNDEGNIEVVEGLKAYGRDIEWVLEEVMGVQYTREKNILLKIEACEDLIENEEYDKAEEAINNLEDIIGENDSEVLTLRNSLAFERIDFEEDN